MVPDHVVPKEMEAARDFALQKVLAVLLASTLCAACGGHSLAEKHPTDDH
eukprot:CAMPEP_0202827516 /NCGR_PEP_ID=MMETSP1389-20130828/14327_1 /ASSEMBLY_ACC=CAM_ASM_000865 /TAXON_ID=302021 /ORGANISM="Rhodomonas sp., Strain CCMP768" /LENGTH=49 /DNA_ID= /DNA_START= /DNA_END= /DNA_ORIENTATION=